MYDFYRTSSKTKTPWDFNVVQWRLGALGLNAPSGGKKHFHSLYSFLLLLSCPSMVQSHGRCQQFRSCHFREDERIDGKWERTFRVFDARTWNTRKPTLLLKRVLFIKRWAWQEMNTVGRRTTIVFSSIKFWTSCMILVRVKFLITANTAIH